MSKVCIYTRSGGGRLASIFCPGCGNEHPFTVDKIDEKGNMWDWNGDVDKPTFSPSMLVNKDTPALRCHSFVEGGKIRFLKDCFHELRDTIVDLPEIHD